MDVYSFQQEFRVAVATIAKSVHRLGFPHEIMLSICSFLHRDWWEDRRKKCWNYACLSEQSSKLISRKMAPGYSAGSIDDRHGTNLEYCRKCHVAMYCSKNCKSRDFYLGHKSNCCPAMSKPPNYDEIQLYTNIFVGKDTGGTSEVPAFLQSLIESNNHTVAENDFAEVAETTDDNRIQVNLDDGDDGENDDASWETMEDEENDDIVEESTGKMSITQLVRKFFDEK